MNFSLSRPSPKANLPPPLKYTFSYGQKQVLLSGRATIDAYFLNDQFGIAMEGDRFGDLISIEVLPNMKGLIIKKLTFKLFVEFRDPETSHWRTMLISDTVDIVDQQEIKIGRYCFKIEIQRTPGKEYRNLPSREEMQMETDSKHQNDTKKLISLNSGTDISARQLNRLNSRVSTGKLSRNSTRELMGRGKSIEDIKEEDSQDIWDYYKSVLEEDYFWDADAKWNNSKGYTESTNFTNTQPKSDSNRVNGSLPSSTLEKTQQISFQLNKQPSIEGQKFFDKSRLINSKPSVTKTIEFFEPDVQKKTVVTKQKSTDSFFDSPLVNKRRMQVWDDTIRDDVDEEDSVSPRKKVQKASDHDDHRAHDRIQRLCSDSSMELQSSKKKVARRKKLNIDEDEEGDDNFGPVSSGIVQSKYDSKALQRGASFTKEVVSPIKRGQQEEDFDENDGNKGKSSSQRLTKRSSLSDNQLKRLKKLVVDKRDAAAKKEPEKINPTQSPKSKENCSICLTEIIGELGRLDGCVHAFCFSCIADWSKVANECPLCRKRFNQITKYSSGNVKLETIQIEFKVQRYDGDLEDLPPEEEMDDACYVCQRDNNPDVLLICDQCHFYMCHTYCCDPPLSRVPTEDWICLFCAEQNGGSEFEDESYSLPRQNNPYRLRFPMRRRGEQPTLLERLFEQTEDLSNIEDNEIRSRVSSFEDESDSHYASANQSYNSSRRDMRNVNLMNRNRMNQTSRNRYHW